MDAVLNESLANWLKAPVIGQRGVCVSVCVCVCDSSASIRIDDINNQSINEQEEKLENVKREMKERLVMRQLEISRTSLPIIHLSVTLKKIRI